MKKPFEDYITFIENELGIKLLYWQEMVLRAIYDGKYPIVSCVRNGKTIIDKAAQLLKEEMARDTGNLPPRLYELDGYSVTVVMCDENWGENIEWEKENKI